MNQAQHIWLAIMTELAIERCGRYSNVLMYQLIKHRNAAYWMARDGRATYPW